jgi:hypothetical protein
MCHELFSPLDRNTKKASIRKMSVEAQVRFSVEKNQTRRQVDWRDANGPQPIGIVTNINPPKTGATYATTNQCGACLLNKSAGTP